MDQPEPAEPALLPRLHDTLTVLRDANEGLLAQLAQAHRSGAASSAHLGRLGGPVPEKLRKAATKNYPDELDKISVALSMVDPAGDGRFRQQSDLYDPGYSSH